MGYRPLDGISRWVRIALYACAAVYGLNALALPSNLAQLEQAASYERSSGRTLLLDTTPSSQFAAVEFAALVVTMIVFLLFFHRAYANLRALAPSEQRYGTGWAVGSWFIPILSIFRPKQIANDIWRGSDGSPVPAVFNWWWAFWLMGGIARFGYSKQVMTVSEAKTVVLVQAAGEVILVAAALSACSVVGLIARRQQLRSTLMADRTRAQFLSAPESVVAPG